MGAGKGWAGARWVCGWSCGVRICVSAAICKGSFDVMSERGQWDQCEVVKSV